MASAPASPDSTWFANAAAIEHSYEHSLAGYQEQLGNSKANFLMSQNRIDRAVPGQLTSIRNRANSEGLATSGQEAQRYGDQQASTASARTQLGAGYQQNVAGINRGMADATTNRNDSLAREAAANEGRRTAEAERTAERNATQGAPAETAPPVPASPAQLIPPTVIGSKPQKTTTGTIRKAAARKVLAPKGSW